MKPSISDSRIPAWFGGVTLILNACGGPSAGSSSDGLGQSARALGDGGTQEVVINTLTAAEKAEGWRLLFDGSMTGWRGFGKEDLPANWTATEGLLTFTPGDDGGDIITLDQFQDFDLSLEWRLGAAGNSGLFFRVTEEDAYPFRTGPEMQILDNDGHADGQNPLTAAGAAYGIYAASEDMTKPVGEWNVARLRVQGPKVEHWLNGTKIVKYELGTEQWLALVAETKFVEWPGYGRAPRGYVSLQDHGDPVWFRNIKILEL